jgi:hypothetical protein
LSGTAVAFPAKGAGGFLSPDRSTYAVGSNGEPTLTLVDVKRMQTTGRLAIGGVGSAYPIAWPERDRLFVEGWACCPTRTEIVVVDPLKRVVVRRVPLVGGGITSAATGTGLVVLLPAEKGIRPVRLIEIDRDGGTRSVMLSRITAGTKWRGKGSNRFAAIRWPGLAVDRAGGAAYVVDPSGLVAQIELAKLDVTYHSTATRRLARASKQIDGPMRFATWVGDRHIAVSGTNASYKKTANGRRQTWAPAGVALLDTRTWTSQMLDSAAPSFTASGGAVLVASSGALSRYDVDGTPRYRTAIPDGDGWVQVFGDYAYAWTANWVTIVDMRSGGIEATLAKPSLYLIGADS